MNRRSIERLSREMEPLESIIRQTPMLLPSKSKYMVWIVLNVILPILQTLRTITIRVAEMSKMQRETCVSARGSGVLHPQLLRHRTFGPCAISPVLVRRAFSRERALYCYYACVAMELLDRNVSWWCWQWPQYSIGC